ncbi:MULTISPECIES: helix-turn-helix domain-containing protein [Phaeobacter]|uniref:helix-turn-helix domain-containing protein n=1 Tax=Phaeobacter TaxID=302485 RepID=UPI0009E52117|nr:MULTISPECIES: helix-turn-helix transcriptional regulator [Phaeobacter]
MRHNIPHNHILVKNNYAAPSFDNPATVMQPKGMKALKRLRKIKGWNQTLLAETAGLDQSTISKVEKGWDGVTLRSLNLIADALGVPTYMLLQDEHTEAEARLLEVFRSLSDERRSGWLDMARSVVDPPQEGDQ